MATTRFNAKNGLSVGSGSINVIDDTGAGSFASAVVTGTTNPVSDVTILKAGTATPSGKVLNIQDNTGTSVSSIDYLGNIVAASGSFGGDVSISGNLFVRGTQTIIDSTAVNIGDNIVQLNTQNSTQATGGLWIADTTSGETGSLIWDSATNKWKSGLVGSEVALASGTGTSGHLSKWTGTSTLGDSIIVDNGTIVAITGSAEPGQNITYDLGSSGKQWLNVYAKYLHGAMTDSNFIQGGVVFANDVGGLIQSSTQFSWDNSNSRLGIGTASPLALLSVGQGSAVSSITPVQISTTGDTGRVYFGANKNGALAALFGFDNLTYGGTVLRNVTASGASGDAISFVVDGTSEAARIDGTGNLFLGTTSSAPNTSAKFTISSTTSTTPALQFRASDVNSWGRLSQSADLAASGSFLSTGGAWSISGLTYSATKDGAGTVPTAALFIGNRFNSTATARFSFLSKAGGSTTTDGTVTEMMVIDGNGNVGIGTTIFTDRLTVSGSSLFSGSLTVTGSMNVTGSILPGTNSSYTLGSTLKKWSEVYATVVTGSSIIYSNAFTGSLTRIADGTAYLLPGTNITLSTGSSGAVTIGTVDLPTGAGTAGLVTRWTGTSTFGTGIISDDGTQVGIGTTTFTSRFFVSGSSTTTTPTAIIKAGTAVQGGGVGIFNVMNSTGTSILFVSGSGYVGIGTTTPTSALDIVGTINATRTSATQAATLTHDNANINFGGFSAAGVLKLLNTNSTTSNYIAQDYYTSTGAPIARIGALISNHSFSTPVGSLVFATRNNAEYGERMRIDQNGNVSIGTGSLGATSTRLFVSGSSTSQNAAFIAKAGISSPAGAVLDVQDYTGTSLFFVSGSGNIAIGTTATNGNKLSVNGTTALTGSVLPGNTTSDLGSSSAKWRTVYATNLTGSLTQLADATPYLLAGDFISLSTGSNGAITITGTPAAQAVSGIGTSNYITKWSTSSTLTNSSIFDDGTNIGIGTATPSYKLTIENSDSTAYAPTTQATPMASLRNTYGSAGNTQVILAHSTANYSSVWNTGLVETGGGAYTGAYIWQNRTGVATWAERMRIDLTGNVGIGTTSFTGRLYVSGSSTTTTPAAVIRAGTTVQGSGTPVFDVQNSAGTSLFFVSGSGNIGIGTSSPAKKLHLLSSTPLRMGTSSEWWDFYQNNTAEWVFVSNASMASIFMNTATGNVSIGGAATTSDKLAVGGSMSVTGSVLPGTNNTYDLGSSSSSKLWRTVYATALSGSHTKLSDGTSYLIGGTGIAVVTGSNGAVTHSIKDSVVATISGSTFTGAVKFSGGLSGSLTTLTDGNPYLIAGTSITLSTGSSGAITINATTANGVISGQGTTSYFTKWDSISSVTGSVFMSETGGGVAIQSDVDSIPLTLTTNNTAGNAEPALVLNGTGVGGSNNAGINFQAAGTTYASASIDSSGVFYLSANHQSSATGGIAFRTPSAAMFLDNTGSLGIRTSLPTAALHVSGSSTAAFPTTLIRAGHTFPTAPILDVQSATGTSLLTVAGLASGNGKIGIGTSSPSAMLHVLGSTATATPTMVVREGSASIPSGVGVFNIQNYAATSLLFVSGSGNIGIGVTNPVYKLQFGPIVSAAQPATGANVICLGGQYSATAGTNSKLVLYNDEYSSVYGLGVSASSQLDYIINTFNSLGSHVWYIGGTEKLRINYSGNVGIGTSSTTIAARLFVAGSATVTTDANLVVKSGTVSQTGYLIDAQNSAGSSKFSVDPSGNVAIGGNLTIAGTSTIINSTIVNIGDNIILLNSVASPNRYGGLYVADTTVNTTGSLIWDSNANTWLAGLAGSEVALPTGTGTTSYSTRWTGTNTLGTGAIFDDGTNVGIGTTVTNGNMLSVNGTAAISGSILPGTDLTYDLGSATKSWGNVAASTLTGSLTMLKDGTAYLLAGTNTIISTGSNGAVTITSTAAAGTLSGAGTANYLSKYSTSTILAESSVYDSGTGVGIGTTTFTGRLYVSGSSTGTTTTLLARHGVAAGSNLPVLDVQNSAGTSLLFVSGSGKVGIGTTVPANALDVRGTLGIGTGATSTENEFTIATANGGGPSGFATFAFPATNVNDEIDFNLSKNGGSYGQFNINFGVSTTNRFRISGGSQLDGGNITLTPYGNTHFASGNVGIGTSGLDAKLVVNGSSVFSGSVSPDGDVTRNLGSSSKRWANVYATALSGSHTQLSDGTSYLIGGTGINVTTGSSGAVTHSIRDSIVATISGSTFTGAVKFNSGLSGSLTTLANGDPYLLAGTSISLSTGSSGAVTIAILPTAGSITGTGTANYSAIFTDTGTIGNGVVYDDGTNVGIGNTAPAVLLHVGSNTAGQTTARINTDGAANHAPVLSLAGAQESVIWVPPTANGGLGFANNPASYSDSNLLAATSMMITAVGNVGIGTTGPGAKFHVSGSSTSTATTSIIKAGVASQLGAVLDVQSNLGTSVLVVSGSGRVGINTASPSINAALDVVGSIRVSANFRRPDDAGVALTVGDGTESHYQDTVTFNGASGVTEFARLTSTGLSVGTKVAATARLDISGSSSDTATTLAIKSGNTAAAIAPVFDVKGTTGATLFFISGSGNVGIGTTDSNGNKLSVNGATAITGSILPGATSTYDLGSSGMKWSTVYATNLTGSLTQLADGTPYIIAGTNVSISTGSNGAVTIAASLSGGAVTGTGTTSYVPRWTNSSTIAAGTMWDDGANIGIGTNVTNGNMLSVNGTTALTGSVLPGNTTSDLGSAAKPWRNIYATSHTTEASTTSAQYIKTYAPGEAGKLTAMKDITASGTATVALDAPNGAVLFDIMVVSSEATGFSIAKKYTVARQYNSTPVSFKIVDTGPGPGNTNDFTVTFSSTNATKMTCTITNGDASTRNFAITFDVAATSTGTTSGTTVTIF